MAQEYIMFNDTLIKQPDQDGFTFSLATTSTEDSGRTQDGVMHNTPMFTAESYSFKAASLTPAEVSTILQIVTGKSKFKAHYFSPYYGAWRDDYFYVSQSSISVNILRSGEENLTDLSFNMIGVNPL